MSEREEAMLKERIDYYFRRGKIFIESHDPKDLQKATKYFAKAAALHEYHIAITSKGAVEGYFEEAEPGEYT